MTSRTVFSHAIAMLALVVAGCAGPPEPDQAFTTALARYLGPPLPLRNPAPVPVQRLGVAVAPGTVAADQRSLLALADAIVAGVPGVRISQRIPASYLLTVPGRGTVQQAGRVYGVDAVLMLSADQFPSPTAGLLRLTAAQGDMDDTLDAPARINVVDVALLPASGVPALWQTTVRTRSALTGPPDLALADVLAEARAVLPAEFAAALAAAR